jgi:hypothetical protein
MSGLGSIAVADEDEIAEQRKSADVQPSGAAVFLLTPT